MDRVCIVMMSAVGDAVHVLPLLTALKRAHPAMHVTWVLQAGPAMLVRGHPLVDEIILFDRSKGWRGFTEIRRALASRRFDLVINLQVYLKAGVITGFTHAPVKLGFDRARARDANWLFTTHRIPARPMQHVQDQYLEFAEWLAVHTSPCRGASGPGTTPSGSGSAPSCPDSTARSCRSWSPRASRRRTGSPSAGRR